MQHRVGIIGNGWIVFHTNKPPSRMDADDTDPWAGLTFLVWFPRPPG